MFLLVLLSYSSISFKAPIVSLGLQEFAQFYIIILCSYSFKITRICPLEIMGRTKVWDWPRAFRLMYKKRAVQMMALYFAGAVVVLVKVGIIVLGISVVLYRYI